MTCKQYAVYIVSDDHTLFKQINKLLQNPAKMAQNVPCSSQFSSSILPSAHNMNNYIPLISRVRGPYGKLWTEFFPSFYGPSAERTGHENKEGKNEDP